MTDFKLYRRWFSTKSTIGELMFIDPSGAEHKICDILEDEARPDGVKIKGSTCIPAGQYEMKLTMSARFGRILPIIYNSPDLTVRSGEVKWEGIRIHPGNTDADTEGCLLPGQKGRDIVLNSREGFTFVEAAIRGIKEKKQREVFSLEIINKQENV